MKALCLLVALFFIVPHHCISQESSPDTVRKNKRNELGLSILTPMIMMAGTPDLANRFTNLTYRRWNGSRHGFKLLAGAIINESNYEDQLVEIRSAAKTYSLVQERRESNLQAGLGYEFLLGGTRLQHSIGADLIYHYRNQSLRNTFHYFDTTAKQIATVDTGSVKVRRIYNSPGINFNYNVRLEISRRWLLTGSMIFSYRYSRFRYKEGFVTNHNFEMLGLLSDLSLFYRF